MIDLNRFAESKKIILPLIKGKGIHEGRKYNFANREDWWYVIGTGDKPRILSKADDIDVLDIIQNQSIIKIKGFVFGDEIVPISFNTAKQKLSMNECSIPIYFMRAEPWQVIKAIKWEDSKLYFAEPDYSYDDTILKEVKEKFDKEQDLQNLKGITPEMRYLFFLFNFERETQKELEKKQEEEEFKKSIGGRLKLAIEKAGGHLMRFTHCIIAGKKRLEVIWKVAGRRFNSLINEDNFQCIEVGFCVEKEDKLYNIERAVFTAKDFEDHGDIYITRE